MSLTATSSIELSEPDLIPSAPLSRGERAFMLILALLFFRGVFSGWDLAYDFDLSKAIRWGVDLGIYVAPAVVSIVYLQGRMLVNIAIALIAYIVASLLTGLIAYDNAFGIEKSLSLTFITALQFSCMVVTCMAIIQGALRISRRRLEMVARFHLVYSFACIIVAGLIGQYYLSGGAPLVLGGRFFFISPISLRMAATFSEPSYLGFYLGFCALHVNVRFPGRRSIAFLLLIAMVLFFVVGAKFATIALPMTLLLSPLVRKLSLRTIRFSVYLLALAVFVAIQAGLDEYIYRHIFTLIDDGEQQTFVTRFSYIFSSFRHLVYFPFGTGLGGWMFSLQSIMTDTLEMTRGLDNSELAEQLMSGMNFAPKDSTSLVLLIAGWGGIVAAVECILALLKRAKQVRPDCIPLIIFMTISLAVYINAIAVPMFFPLAIVVCAELFQHCDSCNSIERAEIKV